MLKLLTSRGFILTLAGLCVAGTGWFALSHFIPAPPLKISIATGFKGGSYETLGRRYQEILARSHVQLDVHLSNGSGENLKLLQDPKSGVQVAFIQGGVADLNAAPDLLSLGRINHQLFWIFYRGNETLEQMAQLKNKRIAVGPGGSGTQIVAAKVLSANGINATTATLLPLAGQEAATALEQGRIDVAFLAFSPDAPVVQSLLRDPQIHLMNFPRAEALTRIYPFLERVVLPEGVIDLEKNIPARDINLIATTNAVLVRSDLHPELINLLAQAMQEVHTAPGLFQHVGEFPTHVDPEYTMSVSAREFYKNGPSFLYRHLPFWITNHVERALAVLLTIVAIIFPLFNYTPKLYLWIVRKRMAKLYRRLRIVEKELQTELSAVQAKTLMDELEDIDRAASFLGIPIGHLDLFFALKTHISLIRSHLVRVDRIHGVEKTEAAIVRFG